MEKTNWFRKLTRTNEEHGEYYFLFGNNWTQFITVRIDEEVDGLTYYYPRLRGHDHLGIVGNSNDIEALTKDMRFVKSVKNMEINDMEAMFSHAECDCTIDEDGEEIPQYVDDEPLYHWH